MKRSHKPVIWSLFAAGGTFAAFVTPAMILLTGLAITFGLLPAAWLDYDRAMAFAQNPLGKALIFIAIFLPAWHAAHRLRITAHDFGIRADTSVSVICYGLAALATVVSGIALLTL